MYRFTTVILALAITALSTGCSLMAPQYSTSLDNIQTLKDAGNFSAKVGGFSSSKDPENANPISIRGSTLSSPYQDSYANYLTEAIKQELSLAKKLSDVANLEITGTLLKNDINITDFTTGFAVIEARFIVKNNGAIRYDKMKSVKHEFPSAFPGAVAIPRAVQEYPFAVQKLLGLLYSDKAFVDSLK